jgi:hypothetical protein
MSSSFVGWQGLAMTLNEDSGPSSRKNFCRGNTTVIMTSVASVPLALPLPYVIENGWLLELNVEEDEDA